MTSLAPIYPVDRHVDTPAGSPRYIVCRRADGGYYTAHESHAHTAYEVIESELDLESATRRVWGLRLAVKLQAIARDPEYAWSESDRGRRIHVRGPRRRLLPDGQTRAVSLCGKVILEEHAASADDAAIALCRQCAAAVKRALGDAGAEGADR